MRTLLAVLTIAFASLLAVVPAAAHHGRGSHADESGSEHPNQDKWDQKDKSDNQEEGSEAGGGFAGCDWESEPESCPGNSGWAHWCKQEFGPGAARGQCIAEHARANGVEIEFNDANDNDDANDNNDSNDNNDNGQQGDLQIDEIDVNGNGSFRVSGSGAEGSVVIWVGGNSGPVVGFGQGDANGDGHFDIRGAWSCRDEGEPRDAKVHAQDDDESDSETASFPCDEAS